jgi:hypothetical protein
MKKPGLLDPGSPTLPLLWGKLLSLAADTAVRLPTWVRARSRGCLRARGPRSGSVSPLCFCSSRIEPTRVTRWLRLSGGISLTAWVAR